MKTKYLISSVILILSFIIIGSVIAADIQYPIEELGNCEGEAACRAYCDKPENIKACIDFAEKNNLMSEEELRMAKKFMATGGKGPGGCQGKEECEEYCNDINHIDECIAFAEKNDLIPPEELEEAKKVQAAIKRGVKPPPCGNKKQCDIYCEESDHMEECINFGIEAGFIQGTELENVQKMLAALKRGVKPPPCHGKEACDEYCSNPDNMELCMNFAMEAGFMSDQEKADSQKMLTALKKGIRPPNCRGKEECDVYCSQDEHFEECFQFAEAAGFMTPEEAEMARKTGGKGPGGCQGKEECEAFCNNPDNQETCFNFGKEHGMIPEEDLRRMEEGKQRFKEMMPSGEGPTMGPGGCQTPDECKTYCESHPEECQKFQPGPGVINPAEQMMPQQAGPGGCKGPEECKVYCESHLDECKNFGSGAGGQFVPGTGPEGQMPQEGMMMQPPEGMTVPPSGEMMGPPPGYEGQMPPDGYQMPPEGMIIPPAGEPVAPPPPPSSWNTKSIMGVILGPFLDIFLIP